MRVVIFSSTEFGYRCIEDGILGIADVDLCGVLTTPAEVSFSKSKPLQVKTHRDFSSLSTEHRFDLYQSPGRVTKAIYQQQIKLWHPDLVLVLGWYYIVPTAIIEQVPLGCVAMHASLLPKYRGMAPITWAIINSEKESGVSMFYLEKGVDTGDIIAQEKFAIDHDDTCATVYDTVTAKSTALLRHNLPLIATGKAPRRKQNHSAATEYPRRDPEDGLIDWRQSATKIYDFVRAQTKPYPGAFSYFRGRKVTIWKSEAIQTESDPNSQPGDIIPLGNQLGVVTGDGILVLVEIQIDGESSTIDPTAAIALNGGRFAPE